MTRDRRDTSDFRIAFVPRVAAAALLSLMLALASASDAATRKPKHASKAVLANAAAEAAAAKAATGTEDAPADPAAERSRQESALKELRDRLESLQREVVEADHEQADAADALRQSERSISESSRLLNDLTLRHNALNRQLALRQSELYQLSREQGSHRQAMSRLVVEQYRRKQQEPVRMLLMGGNPHDVRRHLVYLRALNKARLASLDTAQRRAERVAAIRADTQARLAELDQVVQQSREQRAVLERERREKQKMLAKIAAQLDQRRQALATAQADESRLSKLVAKLTALLDARAKAAQRAAKSARGNASQASAKSSGTSVASPNLPSDMARYKGKLVMPAIGELVARFGVPREAGVSGSPAWKGWFIRTTAGAPVQAVAAGRVVFADWLRGFGNLLIVDHGGGFMSLYGNNDALLQKVGAPVEAGQPIAQAGTSGGAADSGVYFELRHNGVAFDPKQWFSGR
nr:putative lipoprotein [uncultured bacterium]